MFKIESYVNTIDEANVPEPGSADLVVSPPVALTEMPRETGGFAPCAGTAGSNTASDSGEAAAIGNGAALNPPDARENARRILHGFAAVLSAAMIVMTLGIRAAEFFTPASLLNAAFAPCWQLVAEGMSLPAAGAASAMLTPLIQVAENAGDNPLLGLDIYAADKSKAVKGELAIIPRDMSGSAQITNETGYRPDLGLMLKAEYPIPGYVPAMAGVGVQLAAANAPLVLILHTHGTEAYSDEGAGSYPADSGMRSEETEKNIVAVGGIIAEVLRDAGIPTIHSEIMHDKESYLNSYNRSLETVKECLAKYPSIKYVVDVHRDSISSAANGEAYKPVTLVGGKAAAQVMLVVGTDFGGASHPRWHDNLNVAVKLQNLLNEQYGNFARPINLRNASFNQQYAPGSLLLEVGSCANTLAEAKEAAKAFAGCFADLILNPPGAA